jgi:putative membrane protein
LHCATIVTLRAFVLPGLAARWLKLVGPGYGSPIGMTVLVPAPPSISAPPPPTSTARLPLALLAAITPVLVLTAIFCRAGRLNWLLEVAPALLGYVALAATYRRMRLTNFCYVCVFLHTLVLVYGGFYTYAATPLGNWARDTFHLARNDYDRVGHLALGFFPVFIIRETLLRVTPLRRGGWLTFLMLAVVLAIAAAYELVEWWSTYLVAPDVGQAFLGAQGDPWDTQWDMFLGLVGGALGLATLRRAHDRAMVRLLGR